MPPAVPTLWARTLTPFQASGGPSVALDPIGDILVYGGFDQPADFGTGVLTPQAGDLFLLRYSADGVIQAARKFGGTGWELPGSFAIDASGNIYLSGTFTSSINWGAPSLLTCPSAGGCRFIVKLDSSGNWSSALSWQTAVSGAADAFALSVRPSTGEVGLAGNFSQTLSVGGVSITGQIGQSGFAAKLDATGAISWIQNFSVAPSSPARTSAPVFASNGDLIVAGQFNGSAQFTGGSLHSSALGQSGFVTRLRGSNGSELWFSQLSGTAPAAPSNGAVYALALNASDDPLVTGGFTGTVSWPSGSTHASAGNNDIWVARLDAATGGELWSRAFGGSGYDFGWSVAVDSLGAIVVSGRFQDQIDFGGGRHVAIMSGAMGVASDAFILKLTPSGVYNWSKVYSGTAIEVIGSLTIDPATRQLVAGGSFYGGSLDYGIGSVAGARSFLVRLGP